MDISRLHRSFCHVLVLLGVLALFPVTSPAQTNNGLRSSGRDFYIGYMPGLRHPTTWTGVSEGLYLLVGSMQDNNTFSVSFFDQSGNEYSGPTQTVQKGEVKQIPLDMNQLRPTKQGEIPEFKSAHVTARYPVTVQVYQEGSSTGGMYQAIPTNALGTKYIAASWVDNPIDNNPGYLNRDSASGEFMIIAPFDNTSVTYTPNSTTYGGVIGASSGRNSTGVPHPTTITLRRGQIFWVRSESIDPTFDISGSEITSDKPVAVLAGHERALLGDPSGYWTTLDNDIRDIMVEMMTPYEDWGSDYPSIPFMPPANVPRLLQNGAGDMYRVYSFKPGLMNLWQNPTAPAKYSRNVNPYQNPIASYDNITEPVDLLVNSNPDGTRDKMYVVMYDYFQGAHDFDPGGGTSQKGGKSPQDEVTMVCPNEMDVVPIDRYIYNTVFKVPNRSTYKGYQFINVITNRDSLSKIMVLKDRQGPKPLTSYSRKHQYDIPLHPELTGVTYQLAPGDYLLYGNTPFACYSYGRTETQYKDGWGYAAPCGQVYGSRSETQKPKVQVIPNCDHWDIRVTDPRPTDQGIAEIMLLHDPDGFYARPGRDSYNTTMDPQDPSFTPGDTTVSFQVLVNDGSKDGYAAIYVADRAGNDTVIELHYKAQRFPLSDTVLAFGKQTVGDQVCKTLVVHTAQTGASDSATIDEASFLLKDGSFSFTTTPALPLTVHAGDSVVFNVCFTAKDTLAHFDSLLLKLGCTTAVIPVTGKGVTPIILAEDWDFGIVTVGDTVCHVVTVTNIGNADLVLDKNWLLHNTTDFSFADEAILPIIVSPGKSVKLNFCFHPSALGPFDTRQDWGTNIRAPFEHQKKDFSLLRGEAVQPGMNWDRPNQPFNVICDDSLIVRVNLENPTNGTSRGTLVNVQHIFIEGPDAAEFAVVNDEMGYLPLETARPWPLDTNESKWLDVRFKPDLAKGYATRHANLIAIGEDLGNRTYADTIVLTGEVRHAVLSLTPPTYDFGLQTPGTVLTKTFIITNIGDTDAVVQNFDFAGTGFVILRGPAVGTHIPPGQTDTIVVQFTAPDNGSLAGNGNLHDSADCTPPLPLLVMGRGASILVTGTDVPFGTIYICHNDALVASTTNKGQSNATLLSVELREIPGNNELSQFTFTDGSRFQTVNASVPAGETRNFMVKYVPSHNGNAHVQIVYTWLDPIKGDTVYLVNDVTGIGYMTDNTLSLDKPYGDHYWTASTANTVTIPVQLTKPFDPTAQVYGVQFTIRYLRDQFVYQPGSLSFAPQLTPTGTATPVPDPADNNYELLTMKFASATGGPITNIDTLAHVTWEYVVARDSNTTFQIKDLMFLDSTGASTCWVQQDTIPGKFFGTNRCADFTLREYLRTNQLVLSIDHVVPNPVQSTTRIDYRVNRANAPVTIEVFNALGDRVATLLNREPLQVGGYQAVFDAKSLPSGIYTVRVSTQDYEATKSILVAK